MKTIKRWGLMLENMCYLPMSFYHKWKQRVFLRKYPEYVKENVRIAPIQEIHISKDMQPFNDELKQLRSRVLTENY